MGSLQLKAASILAGHIDADAITTDKLAAGVVTAEKLAAGAVDAGALSAITAKIGSLTAGDIETDTLAAGLAAITVLTCGSATFDRATVTHLVSEAMNLEYGVAGQVFIRNLAVEYAQMIGATIGNLCIKASDGNYYSIDVDADGNVSATKTTVSSGEISAGQTSGGRVILETNITAANLNTSNLLATYALINKIDAARIDVAELFAQSAFVDALYTSKIYGGKSLEIIAGEASDALGKIDNLQIGGRNLLLKSATKHISPGIYGSTLAFTDGVSVSEWGASDAIRCTGVSTKYLTFGILDGVSVDAKSINNQAYTNSIYIRNDGAGTIRVKNSYTGDYAYVQVGESKRVILQGMGDGATLLQFNFLTTTKGEAIDITYWHPKIELGNVATDWTSAPEDNAEIVTGNNPPALPIKTGTLWIDTGVTPTVIRRWKGTGTSTDRDEGGWDTVSDLEEINQISNKLAAQQAEAQKAIDQLATAITIDTGGAHFYKPGYRDRSEVRIDQDSVDILVNGSVNSSFIAGGLILGNYMLWHPAAAGGLAFNLYSEA